MRSVLLNFAVISVIAFFSDENDAANIIHAKESPKISSTVYQQLKLFRGIIEQHREQNAVILDPLVFDKTQINLEGLIYKIQANISSGTITGLRDIAVKEHHFIKEDLTLTLKLNLPRLIIESDYYEMTGSVMEFVPLAGKGRLEVGVENFCISTKLYLKQSNNGKSIVIDRLENTEFTVQNVWSHTEFDQNFDDIFNKMVTDLLADYLSRFNKYLAATYGDYVVSIINSLLCQFELWEILESLLNGQ